MGCSSARIELLFSILTTTTDRVSVIRCWEYGIWYEPIGFIVDSDQEFPMISTISKELYYRAKIIRHLESNNEQLSNSFMRHQKNQEIPKVTFRIPIAFKATALDGMIMVDNGMLL